jgi:hypothetical protein
LEYKMRCLDIWLEASARALGNFPHFSDKHKESVLRHLRREYQDAQKFILSGTPEDRLLSELKHWHWAYSEEGSKESAHSAGVDFSPENETDRKILRDLKTGIKEALDLFQGPLGFAEAFERLRLLEEDHNIAVPSQLSPSSPFWADLNPKYQDPTISA